MRREVEESIWKEIKLIRKERKKKKIFMENIKKEKKHSGKFKERLWDERIQEIEEKMIERENKVKEWIENAEKRLKER